MARSKFELVYRDGSRKQISSAERNSLLLSRDIEQTTQANRDGRQIYRFIGQVKTFHAFADLAELLPLMALPANLLRHYLEALCVIFEFHLKRERQFEQTPEAAELRLETPMGQACKFNLNYAIQEFERRSRQMQAL